MLRTYAAPRGVVKGIVLGLVLVLPSPGQAQGLPGFAPLNPVAASRTGLYFQPYREPAPERWIPTFQLEYASIVEYNQRSSASYVLDSEILRISLGLSRDLGRQAFIYLGASAQGAYQGFLDGFLDWYHGTLGIRVREREERPRDQFLYAMTLPGSPNIVRSRRSLFLGDSRVGLGFRLDRRIQTVLSVTLPTSTGPQGYGRGVPSLNVLTTARGTIDPRVAYQGSIGVGFTPRHGAMSGYQRTTFLALSSGVRYRVWGSQAVFGNLFYHSPYYRGTSLPALDRRELSLDFGWILETPGGGEWRVGMTQDLEPGGPGIDLVVRVGRSF